MAIPKAKEVSCNVEDMKINAIRVKNVGALRKESEGQVEFAAKISRQPAQVSHWITGNRNIGEKIARHIEQSFRLEEGWLR